MDFVGILETRKSKRRSQEEQPVSKKGVKFVAPSMVRYGDPNTNNSFRAPESFLFFESVCTNKSDTFLSSLSTELI